MQKLTELRALMDKNQIDAYIITKNDPHNSEYSPDYWNGVKFISGFSGSNGIVVVTKDMAGLWTDGRYYIQAKRQLGEGFTLFRASESDTPKYFEWAAKHTAPNRNIGFDGRTISAAEAKKIQTTVSTNGVNLVDIDLVDRIWSNRPTLSDAPVFNHDIKYCGVSRTEKISALREKLKSLKCGSYLLSSLDDIAWLLNLRGRDIIYNMVFRSYVVVEPDKLCLFIPLNKLDSAVYNELTSEGITILPYEQVGDYISELKSTLYVNIEGLDYALFSRLPDSKVFGADITTQLKAIKNKVELENLRHTQIKDGVAMVRFIKKVKELVLTDEVREYDLSELAESFRKEQDLFIQPSFETISAYMANAAMIHYSAVEGCDAVLEPKGMVLVDSGGQYLGGTTDITRTFSLGVVSEEQMTDYTLVLKSHIAIATAVFLYGATGTNLDVLARQPLWERRMDYKHGTGHGLGYCLGVHEGPHGIRMQSNPVRLEEGMLITNEPGLYHEDKYGIRTENTVVVKELEENGFGRFMCLETISFCPFDLSAIKTELLTDKEISWLNQYHKDVYDNLSPYLDQDEKKWLLEQTSAVCRKGM